MTSPHSRRPCIVCGYDGSPASRAALSLAVARAQPDGRVVVVHAFPAPRDRYGGPSYQTVVDADHDRAEALLRNLEEEVPGLGALDWTSEVVAGAAAGALTRVAETEHASEILIGTRGFGRTRALLGSVAHRLIHTAPCPITMIPARALAHVTDRQFAVTVGDEP